MRNDHRTEKVLLNEKIDSMQVDMTSMYYANEMMEEDERASIKNQDKKAIQVFIDQALEGKPKKDDEEKQEEELQMPALEMPVLMITIWKCPECKLFNKIEDEFCAQCKKVLQLNENQGNPPEEIIFQVKPDLLQQAKQQDKKVDLSDVSYLKN